MNTLIKVDLNAKPEEQDIMHNRWHPEIPMVAMVDPGDEFRVECVDWTGGQVANTDDASDIKYVDLSNQATCSPLISLTLVCWKSLFGASPVFLLRRMAEVFWSIIFPTLVKLAGIIMV